MLRVVLTPQILPTSLQLAEEEEFESKRKELEELASPIFTRMYQGAGGGGEGGMPGGACEGGGGGAGGLAGVCWARCWSL